MASIPFESALRECAQRELASSHRCSKLLVLHPSSAEAAIAHSLGVSRESINLLRSSDAFHREPFHRLSADERLQEHAELKWTMAEKLQNLGEILRR